MSRRSAPGPRLGRRRRRFVAVAVAGMVASGALTACGGSDGGVPTINLYGSASDAGFDKILASCNEAAQGRYRIVGNLIPSDADSQREQFVRRLAAQDDGMDVLGMDVTWTAEFAEAGWIRELTGEKAEAATDDVLQPPIDTATWKDKLYGIPRTTNVQLLWFRKSLVPDPPKTWQDVISQAEKLKTEDKPYVVGITAAQYEGYVVGFNTILSSLGGTLVNEDSTEVTVDDKTVEALKIIKQLATSGVASKSLSNSQEPELFAQMQNGEAAFIMNWPYVLSAMKAANPEVAQDLGVEELPEFASGEEPKATLGGMNYAISKYSKHPDLAYDAAMCLRNPDNLLQGALDAGNVPVIKSVFEEPEFKKAYPMAPEILAELETAVPRPVTPLYQNISTIVSSTLSPPSSIDPEKTAEELKSKIQDAIDGKGILP
ncbi:carbohydrate ABC transporter substrate-binding protein, CUT1 family [Nocardioides scoriae]|uniref:Carbohydrate ABC transporter substrate-binding protein, CUT1 family n=1 Tax=Nocardioides scoriae TaxID=642780 RepID=A0A1H1LEN7_9ACTN|nr:ABC transporter substrate-binding protein [Nocardioides scoriae]SDR72976.1 carbohydrate ABC transporter substrate-binding protein, CUT1 family [Nocardioides scoriae]